MKQEELKKEEKVTPRADSNKVETLTSKNVPAKTHPIQTIVQAQKVYQSYIGKKKEREAASSDGFFEVGRKV